MHTSNTMIDYSEYDTLSGYVGESEYKPSLEIGKLIELFKTHSSDVVKFVNTKFSPCNIDSWRGSYDIPAITYDLEDRTGDELYRNFTNDMTQIHRGYKGGDYTYRYNQIAYVANYGNVGHEIQVVGSHFNTGDGVLYLLTKIVKY